MTAGRETRAEAFRGSVGREGIVLEFGLLGAAAPPAQTTVRLTDRVVLPLETAQRLLLALNDALQRGTAEAAAPGVAAPSRGEVPVNAAADPAAEKGALLMRRVSSLGVPFQHERSFSMSEGELAGNRFLLTVGTADLGEEPLGRVADVLRPLGMPAALQPAVAASFGHSRCIHFGFEKRRERVLCKLYLEQAFTAADVAEARAAERPILLHVAFKWDAETGEHVVSRYRWHPELPAAGIEARLEGLYGSGSEDPSLDVAKAVLRLAASRCAASELQYLEVVEDGNGRRSFDLNLYPATLQVRDVQHLLSRMRTHYGIRPGQFQALLDQVKGRTLGHVSGGLHRDGRDFLTVYYGVEGYPRFAAAAAR